MIATEGYSYNGPATQSSSAFFPAYPTVLWALHAVTGVSVKLLGTLVTLACGAGVVVLFRRWCDDRVDPVVAAHRHGHAAALPLRLLPDGRGLRRRPLPAGRRIGAFLLLERGHPVLAGLVGAVATAARPVGIAVVVGLVAVTLWRKGTIARRDGPAPVRPAHVAPGRRRGRCSPLGGILGWMTYLGVRFGHPFAFEEVQQAPGWDQGSGPHTWFKVLWFQQLKNLPGRFLDWWRTGDSLAFEKWLYGAGVVLQGLLVLGFLWLAWQAWRRFGWGYGLYSFALLAIPLIGTKDFQGAGRYLLAAFPCYLALARDAGAAAGAASRHLDRGRDPPGGVGVRVRPGLLRCVTCMANFESLTIFYPMWNEEATIERAVGAAFEAGDLLVAAGEIGRYDVLIVDDASTDATGEIADALAAGDPRVSVVHHPTNRKLGGSLKTGFANATGELILYTDADLPFDMAEAAKAVRLMRIYEADIVSAYRFDRTGEGARRLVYSYVYNHLVQADVRPAPARHELRVQARPAIGVRARRAAQRGVVHRRRAAGPGPAPRLSASCSSASTTSPAPGASRRSRRTPSSPRSSGRCSSCGPTSRPSSRSPPTLLRHPEGFTPEVEVRRGRGRPVRTGHDRGRRAPTAARPARRERRRLRPHRGRVQGDPATPIATGIVTSTSVLALAPGFAPSVRWLDDAPHLGRGAHLAAVGEDPPLLSAREVPTLVDRRGRMWSSWRVFLPRAAAGRIDPDDLRREFAAQIDAITSAGVAIDHLDTHQNIHLWPMVSDVVLGLGRAARRPNRPGHPVDRARAGRCHRAAAGHPPGGPTAGPGLAVAGGLDRTRRGRAPRAGRHGGRARRGSPPRGPAPPSSPPIPAGPTTPSAPATAGRTSGRTSTPLSRSSTVRTAVTELGFELGTFADLDRGARVKPPRSPAARRVLGPLGRRPEGRPVPHRGALVDRAVRRARARGAPVRRHPRGRLRSRGVQHLPGDHLPRPSRRRRRHRRRQDRARRGGRRPARAR